MSARKKPSISIVVIVFLLSVFSASPVLAQATLENPTPSSFQSGIGVISGWVCDATRIEITFDGGPPVEAAYGTDRIDTQSVCGDTDNGFGLLFNWNRLGDGTHTVRALADGVEFANVQFRVTTFGEEFLTDDLGAFQLPEIPVVGTAMVLRWQQSQQKFVITDGSFAPSSGTSGAPLRVLENPAPGSFQSGIGVISGWACEASRIEITFNDGPPVEAAYGTSRADTRGACGDANNGFGLLFNWNRLGDGTHTVRALADGVEFANVQFRVTTFGMEFLTDDLGAFRLQLDPLADMYLIVKYEKAQQAFVPWGCATQEEPTSRTQCDPTRLKGGTRVHDVNLPGLQVRLFQPWGFWVSWDYGVTIRNPNHTKWQFVIQYEGKSPFYYSHPDSGSLNLDGTDTHHTTINSYNWSLLQFWWDDRWPNEDIIDEPSRGRLMCIATLSYDGDPPNLLGAIHIRGLPIPSDAAESTLYALQETRMLDPVFCVPVSTWESGGGHGELAYFIAHSLRDYPDHKPWQIHKDDLRRAARFPTACVETRLFDPEQITGVAPIDPIDSRLAMTCPQGRNPRDPEELEELEGQPYTYGTIYYFRSKPSCESVRRSMQQLWPLLRGYSVHSAGAVTHSVIKSYGTGSNEVEILCLGTEIDQDVPGDASGGGGFVPPQAVPHRVATPADIPDR